MLTKLLPDQISKFWDIIKYAIEQSIPPNVGEHPDKSNRILSAALSGKVDVWASYDKSTEVNRFEGLMLTKILYDDVVDMKNLLIYSVYGYETISEDSWKNGLRTILKYAAGNNCSLVVAYTDVPKIVEVVNSLGGDTSFTFISFNINKLIKSFN